MFEPVEYFDADGRPYTVWEQPLRRIADDYLKAVVFLYRSREDASEGIRYGGTGVHVSIPPESSGGDHIYVVTNAHVAVANPVVRTANAGNPIFAINRWTMHPDGDDLAVAYMGSADYLYGPVAKVIPMSMALTPETFATNQIGPGDQLFMTGRFTGVDEKERTAATVRSGTLVMSETTEIDNKDTGHKQESFLGEVHSKAGYSGSPVYVDIPPMSWGVRFEGRRPGVYLLGITWGLWQTYVPILDGKTRERVPEKTVIATNSGVEMIVPIWKLTQLLMKQEALVAERKQHEARVEEDRALVRPEGVVTTDDGNEASFTKAEFENALKKVSRRKPSPSDEGTSGT